MKNIEKLIKEAKNDYVGLVIPKDLIDIAIKYFNNKDLTEYISDLSEYEKRELVIDFSNEIDELDYGLVEWYKDHDYKLITLTKEDFIDSSNITDDRTLLIVHSNMLAVNDNTNDIYFSTEEAEHYLGTVISHVYTIIPAYGKNFERKPHISLY